MADRRALRPTPYRGGAASHLTARVDPVSCPACRVLQRLLFAREVIERIELVTAFGARAFGAFEQKVGREPTIGQTMRCRVNGIAVVLLNVFLVHFSFNEVKARVPCAKCVCTGALIQADASWTGNKEACSVEERVKRQGGRGQRIPLRGEQLMNSNRTSWTSTDTLPARRRQRQSLTCNSFTGRPGLHRARGSSPSFNASTTTSAVGGFLPFAHGARQPYRLLGYHSNFYKLLQGAATV